MPQRAQEGPLEKAVPAAPQLGDGGEDAPGLVAGEQLRRSAGSGAEAFWLGLLVSSEMPDCQKYQHKYDGPPAQTKRARREYCYKTRDPHHSRDCKPHSF
jgi:hypothetical protein